MNGDQNIDRDHDDLLGMRVSFPGAVGRAETRAQKSTCAIRSSAQLGD
jgi:hypothetical protein